MTSIFRSATFTALAVAAVAGPAIAQPSAAGRIDRIAGAAVILRAGAQVPLKAGDTVLETDVLRTGPDGRVGVTLRDDTRLSLGPASEVRLEKFLYSPSEGQIGLTLRVVRGLVAYVSGRIAKLAPDAVRLETPAAIVGVRGTTLIIEAEE
jgi:hypothetical protein